MSLQDFEDYRDADDAVYDLNGKEYMGERYTIRITAYIFSVLVVDFMHKRVYGFIIF